MYLQQIDDKAVIVVEISPGKQRPYYIKATGIKDGTNIRVAGSKINASTEKQNTSIETGNNDTKTSMMPTNCSTENFCADNAGFCANTENSTEPDNTSQKDDRTSVEAYSETELNDREKKLLELIRENPSITMNKMAAVCGLSKSSICYTLDGLRNRGVITRKGSQKKGVWMIHG